MLETLENHMTYIYTCIRLSCIRTLQAFECLRHSSTTCIYTCIRLSCIANVANIQMLDHESYTCIRLSCIQLSYIRTLRTFKCFRHSRITRFVNTRVFNFRAFERCKHSNNTSCTQPHLNVVNEFECLYTYVYSTFVYSNIASIRMLQTLENHMAYTHTLHIRTLRIFKYLYICILCIHT